MRAALAEGPALIHWVVRTRDIEDDAARCPTDLGVILPMQRGDFRWRITVPEDGHLPARGLVPTLIEWSDERHPADGLPDSGVQLVALAGGASGTRAGTRGARRARVVGNAQGHLWTHAAAGRDAAHAARCRDAMRNPPATL